NTALLNFQQLTSAWVPQDQGFNPINGLRLSTTLQGPEAPLPLEYGLAYGFLLFDMDNIDNLGGTSPFAGPPPKLSDGGLPNWLLSRLPLGSGAPGEVPPGRPPDGGPPGRWRPVIGVFPPHGGAGNCYYYYYNVGVPAQNNNN
ncbi:hypothetical protein C0995_005162, partial [Termitomyces sp. Mi166